MAEAMCYGGVNIAARWGRVTQYTACRPGPQSGVTDDLHDLSEVRARHSAALLKRNFEYVSQIFYEGFYCTEVKLRSLQFSDIYI